MDIFFIHTTESTQNHAKLLFELHFMGVSFWVHSSRQTRGRGQRGRNWVSQPGNLFLTGCFPSQKVIPGQLSIKIGVLIVDILRSWLSIEGSVNLAIGLKWPNDLLINGQKCGGILIEMAENIYIGIGINIANHPSDTPMPATHLFAHMHIPALLAKLVMAIVETIDIKRFVTQDFSAYQELWWKFAKDQIASWQAPGIFSGEVIGVDALGRLLVQDTNSGKITAHHQIFAD
jgi:BirA family transcriptional regulator, biotin operon repressor / biotin---[acetyl-CoA-carboxylase] ligase